MPTIFDARVTLAKVADSEPAASDIEDLFAIPNTDKIDKQRRQLPAPPPHYCFHIVVATIPPDFVTRRISFAALEASAIKLTTSRAMVRSKDLSA
jgi:hypothetical protein